MRTRMSLSASRPGVLLVLLAAASLLTACGGGGTPQGDSSSAAESAETAGFDTPSQAAAAALHIDDASAATLLAEADDVSAQNDLSADAAGSRAASGVDEGSASTRPNRLYRQILGCMQRYVDANNLISLDMLGRQERFDCAVVGSYRGTMRLGLAGSKFTVRSVVATQDPPLSCRVWFLPGGLTIGTVGTRAWYRWDDPQVVQAALASSFNPMYVGTAPPLSVTPLVYRSAFPEVQFCQGLLAP